MRSNPSGKKGIIERFERYFGQSVSIKVAVCMGIVIMFLASLMLFALFMNVFTPGSVADCSSERKLHGGQCFAEPC